MAIFFVRTTIVSRRRGQSALACAAYRTGQKLEDKYYGAIRDYTKKQGVIASGIEAPIECPPWVFDRENLYWEVEKFEDTSTRRQEAQLLREFIIALPWELKSQSKEVTQKICKDIFAKEGMIADWSVHEPSKYGDTRNIHAHILVTMRKIDANGFNSSKERSWNSKKYHSLIKQDICHILNASLRSLGIEESLDSRSYKEQGIEISATRHKGPKRTAIERKDLPLYIDKEIKQDWSVCIRRRAIAIDEANGYKLIAKAITGTEDDKSKAISFFKSAEKKWIDHITDSAPRNGQYSDIEISQQARAMYTSNEAFLGLRQGKQKAMELFQPNQREYNGWER